MSAEPNHNTHLQVKNLKNTGERECGCGTWLAHWRKFSKTRPDTVVICAKLDCGAVAEVGAHVQLKDGRRGDAWFIVPLCRRHNMFSFDQPFWLKKSYRDNPQDVVSVHCRP